MFGKSILIFFFLRCAIFGLCDRHSGKKLLLISFDGFRHDYIELAKINRTNVSAFELIWKRGFRVLRVLNEFTTLTGPNHFSIVTGQHEESHGIVDNLFYDPSFNETFNFANVAQQTESRWFNSGAEPIWVTNQKQGFQSFTAFWIGSTADIQDKKPTYFYPKFNFSLPLRTRFDDALHYLKKTDVNLALVYFHEPDHIGHLTGPLSDDLLSVIGRLNDDLNYLMQKVDSDVTLREQLNIVVTSDHGMTYVNRSQMIILADIISPKMYYSPGDGVRIVWSFWPREGYTSQDLYDKLTASSKKHMHVFQKRDIPQDLFYSRNPRIGPVIAYADPGWLIASTLDAAHNYTNQGDHGYDPNSSDMSPFLIAAGPGIRQQPGNGTIPRLKMVDLYPMMCHLLGLTRIGPHNGSLSNVRYLLKGYQPSWTNSFIDLLTIAIVFGAAFVLAGLFSLFGILSYLRGGTQSSINARRRARINQFRKQYVFTNDAIAADPNMSAATGVTQNFPLNVFPPSEDTVQLLKPGAFGQDVVVGKNNLDEKTLFNMLHGPRGKYP